MQPALTSLSRIREGPLVTPYRLAVLGIVLLSLLVFGSSVSGLAIWDDGQLLDGRGIGGGTDLAQCFTHPFLGRYFRPLTSLSFLLEHRLWGTNLFLSHQTNILLHLFTTLAIVGFVRTLTNSSSVALTAGLLFAFQPVQVSAVAWIGGRTDALAAFWVAIFAWTLIRAARSRERSRIWWIVCSFIAYLLALFTKEQALALLPIAPLAFMWLSSERPRLSALSCLSAPYALAAIAYLAAWSILVPIAVNGANTPSDQLSLAGRTISYYTLALIIPSPRWISIDTVVCLARLGSWTIWSGYAAAGVVFWLCVYMRKRSPMAAWCMAFVALGLLPVCNFIPLKSLVVAPYRAAIPGVGLSALLAIAIWSIRPHKLPERTDNSANRVAWNITIGALGAAYLLLCGLLCIWGVRQWASPLTISEAYVRFDPDSIFGRANLAAACTLRGDTNGSAAQYQILLSRLLGRVNWKTPDSVMTALHDPEVRQLVLADTGARDTNAPISQIYGKLGLTLLLNGDTPGALIAFNIGRKLEPRQCYVNLGLGQIALDDRKYSLAEGCLRVAAIGYLRDGEWMPENMAAAHGLLGEALTRQNHWQAGAEELASWSRLQPASAAPYCALARAQEHLGNLDAAARTLQIGLEKTFLDKQLVNTALKELRARHPWLKE